MKNINIESPLKIKIKEIFKPNLKKIKEESQIGKYFLKNIYDIKSGFGDIFLVINNNEDEYIMKVQKKKIKNKNYILQEYEIYKHLEGSEYISKYIDYFTCHNTLHCLILIKYDIDLKKLFNKDRIFFYSKQKKIIKRILKILEDIHNRGVVHGDIKFSNIMYNYQEDKIYIIDFGCSRFLDRKFSLKKKRISGTLRYASLDSHKGICDNNLNDIESLLYSILEIEIYPRELLWKGRYKKYHSTMGRWDKIYEIKRIFLEKPKVPKKMKKIFKYYKCRQNTKYMRRNNIKFNYDDYINLLE